jgi:hypothetical protein
VSTERSAQQEWEELEYDAHGYDKGYARRIGRISWSHTSDTVAWEVDGKSAYIMSPAEFAALRKACGSWGDS